MLSKTMEETQEGILNLKVVERKRRQVQLQRGGKRWGGAPCSPPKMFALYIKKKIKDDAAKGEVEVRDKRRPCGIKQSRQLHGQGSVAQGGSQKPPQGLSFSTVIGIAFLSSAAAGTSLLARTV